MSADGRQASLAASLQLEQELDRALEIFAQEHAVLVRAACQLPDDVGDLAPVVLTVMYGHAVSRMRKLRGRAATEQIAATLLDAFEHAEALAAQRRAGEGQPSKEAMH